MYRGGGGGVGNLQVLPVDDAAARVLHGWELGVLETATCGRGGLGFQASHESLQWDSGFGFRLTSTTVEQHST